jgi:ubiquinone biosynthesis protein
MALATPESDPVHIPKVYTELTNQRMLVMEELEGTPLSRMSRDDLSRLDGRALADTLFAVELTAMIEGRRFQADPHPGNVLISAGGELGLIDFGSTAKLARSSGPPYRTCSWRCG